MRCVEITSHQFFKQGKFHFFKDGQAYIEHEDGTCQYYDLSLYTLKFTT